MPHHAMAGCVGTDTRAAVARRSAAARVAFIVGSRCVAVKTTAVKCSTTAERGLSLVCVVAETRTDLRD